MGPSPLSKKAYFYNRKEGGGKRKGKWEKTLELREERKRVWIEGNANVQLEEGQERGGRGRESN